MGSKFYYILIWGHGIKFAKSILNMIRANDNLKIIKIIYHKPESIKKLIDVVYSYDYAPIEHLKSKIEYLKSTPGEVVFIFIENKKPNVDLLGDGDYRHEESLTLKEQKEAIRNEFNPKINGTRSEDHVIHASDNELQTDYILKYLGLDDGLAIFNKKNKIISSPYYIKNIRQFKIKKIRLDLLVCNIATGLDRYDYDIETVDLHDAPQYRGLTQNIDIYTNYVNKFIGGPLTQDYYPEKLIQLSKELSYLNGKFKEHYVLVEKQGGKFLILDGLHRASILASRNTKELKVCEVLEYC